MLKTAKFHASVRDILREFPDDVRRDLGKTIFDLQKGHRLTMPLSKPMASVGLGVEELRVKDRYGIYRVFYLARRADVVLVFHAFQKKTQRTPPHEIELGKKRLKEMLHEEE